MLKIFFGEYEGPDYIPNPDMYFDNQHADEWMEDPLTKQMVKDVDRSEIVGSHLIESPFLGPIPPERLSGGVKTLIMIDHDDQHVYNISACGNNCAKWLLEICETKDRLVRLGYIMDFGENSFSIQIANTGKIVHTMAEFMDELIDHDLV